MLLAVNWSSRRPAVNVWLHASAIGKWHYNINCVIKFSKSTTQSTDRNRSRMNHAKIMHMTHYISVFRVCNYLYMYVIAVNTHLAVLRVSTAATTAAHKHTTQPACRVSLSVYQIVNLIYQLFNLLQSKVIKSPTCKDYGKRYSLDNYRSITNLCPCGIYKV